MTSPRLPNRGRLWWRQEFYAIHSHHLCHECPADTHGTWHNVWGQRLSRLLYACCPRVWRWWVNRPGRAARRAERLFPRMKGPERSDTPP